MNISIYANNIESQLMKEKERFLNLLLFQNSSSKRVYSKSVGQRRESVAKSVLEGFFLGNDGLSVFEGVGLSFDHVLSELGHLLALNVESSSHVQIDPWL